MAVPSPASSQHQPTPVLRPALDRTTHALLPILDRLTDRELDSLTIYLQQAADPPTVAEPTSLLAAAISGHRPHTVAERITLEADALVSYFLHRRQLLEGALTTSQVARILGTSRQTPHDRVKSGSLLAVLDRGILRFPAWQFDPEGPDGVVAGLPEVLRALHTSPLSKVNWLVRANPYFNGDSPLAVLKRREIDRVVLAARAVEAD